MHEPKGPAGATPRRDIDAAVAKVVLYEDRALVERRGQARLEAGLHWLRVRDVSPVLVDRSLFVRSGGSSTVEDARVCREWRIGASEQPAVAAALTREHEQLELEIARTETLLAVARDEVGALERASELFFDGWRREMPYVEQFRAEWKELAARLSGELRRGDETLHAAECLTADVHARRLALAARSAEAARVDYALCCDLEILVAVHEAGLHTLRIGYVTPCALWRPAHRACLRDGRLHFECEGAVWQATGESWRDVELFFSTARSTQRAEPPLLVDDVLRTQAKVDRTLTVGVREQTIATTGEGLRDEVDLPGVEDGGEARLLAAASKVSIEPTGRLARVPIFAFDTAAETDRVARPERSLLVHLRSRQANASTHPILAGPVDLLQDSGYVGRTEVGFVASGEKFALGFGGDAALRIKRDVREERAVAKLTGKVTVTRTVELHLSNLDDRAVAFALEERIPISEIEQVRVSIDAKLTKPVAAPDDNGIVRWPVQLAPRGRTALTLVYEVVAASDVRGV